MLSSDISEERDGCPETGLGEGRAPGALPVLGFPGQEVCPPGRVPDGMAALQYPVYVFLFYFPPFTLCIIWWNSE